MSKDAAPSGRAITLDQALVLLSLMESEIEYLRKALSDIEARMSNLSSLKESLEEIRNGADDALIPVDAMSVALVKASIKPVERVVVSIGLGYFAELEYKRAIELVNSMEKRLQESYAEIAGYLQALLSQYESLAKQVESVVRRQAEARSQTGVGRA